MIKFLYRLFIIKASLFALCLSAYVSDPYEIPSLDELVQYHYENNNGKAHFDDLSSLYATGRILYFQDDETVERAFRIFKKRPNKYRAFYQTNIGKKNVQLELIFDGVEAIQIFSHDGTEVYRERLEDNALEEVKQEASIEGPFLLASEQPEYITIEGYDYIGDEKCVVLSIDERSKYPFDKIWLSLKHYQEIKFEQKTLDSEGISVIEEVYFKDYKKVQNILLASRIDKNIDGKRRFSTFIDNFEINYGLFDSLFKIDGKPYTQEIN